jgi:hypothetical protein
VPDSVELRRLEKELAEVKSQRGWEDKERWMQ